MAARELPEKFRVAFSFAGEQRDLVRPIAEAVEQSLGRGTVFLDEWFEHYIAGQDAELKLQEIYGERSELVVVCVSRRYGDKPWTLAEHDAILARTMKARSSQNNRDRLGILPIRVGEGEVKGILFTTIVPDVRKRPTADSANLILDRLCLMGRGLASEEPAPPAIRSWPREPIPFKHGLADRTVREWPAVLQLLTADSPKRILLFKGPSNYSKSALLNAADKYARTLHASRAYIDFKDTNLLSEANVLRKLQSGLGQVLRGFEGEINRWMLSDALRALQGPVLLLLDTYENATETKELVQWIEIELLAEAEECDHLRIIIAGQKAPDLACARWRDRAEAVELDRIDDQRIWKEWIHEINPNVDEKHVEGIVLGCDGVPGNISTSLRTVALKASRPR